MKLAALAVCASALMALAGAGTFATADAQQLVAKSEKAGGQGHGKGHGNDHGNKGASAAAPAAAANDKDRVAIVNYFNDEYTAGRCPPGLAKKNNGCLPPGQAKKWGRGDYLPSDADYYDLPEPLLGTLQPVPDGYRYVRVDRDILLDKRDDKADRRFLWALLRKRTRA